VEGLSEGGIGPVDRTLGDYEILAEVGSGGMGIVYRALQRSLRRLVALKVIREELASDSGYRERFIREARVVAVVDHPHVVSIFDVGQDDGRLYLAMQWIEGQDLTRLLASSGRLAPERAVPITIQLAGALDAVHSVAGFVHRDVKPANVLIRTVPRGDHAYLTDFGVAKPSHTVDHLTQAGFVVGTAGYLSPEQIMGAEPGPRSDLYALGCVCFEALTGQPPFAAENEMALRWAHATDPRPAASAIVGSLHSSYDDFFEVALAVDPLRRFASGRAFANALAAAHTAAVESGRATQAARGSDHVRTDFVTPLPPAPNVSIEYQHTPLPPMYAAQPYPYHPQRRSGNGHQMMLIVLIVLSVLVVAGVAIGVLVAAGAFSGGGGGAKLIPPTGT
jgi:serine/threonine protein kinase